ncbi:glycerol-3-phosphate dehydrogenase/oxidase [Roseibium sp. CAU 1637]|uniref:Glycerol-3-phosphate dehydrogenase/oxidase n=1 Tax=Roseibium limicola TaxID=2816037 RepID=A0A939ERM4_9HYPH|nr:glycerol-3-phosphate dehydrogenase/oxidase [Roseibium limicola]MBO0346293.1 glycerol-3-phosphate dehydrogenase/oxidase [Roseibium limicola]
MSAQRQTSFQKITENGAFDVVVIGGGINGLGVYRELSLQGLRVLLVERNDFCSGCSAAPSRMIHGGLRYLENGEVDLVRESLAERDALLANAPHMVRPLPTTIPITSWFSGLFNSAATFIGKTGKPSNRGVLPVKIGLALYDRITGKRSALPRHQFRGASATLKTWPRLTRKLLCSATYHDAWISYPERLGVELILDTAQEVPTSVALNYAELLPANTDVADAFEVEDRETGARYAVSTRVLVNASGAWLDQVNAQIAPTKEAVKPLVSGTKGSHLIINNGDLFEALNGHMLYFENTDGRVCIVFPYLGNVLAGSTDIRVQHVARTRCSKDERDYILGSLQLIFPDILINRDNIVFSFSGIRPLPISDHDFTGRISRNHKVHRIDGPVPQFCMIGGKWTTFRAFSEQTTDAVLQELGLARLKDTKQLPIGGGKDFPNEADVLATRLMEDFGISRQRADYLTDVYGTRARLVIAACQQGSNDEPLVSGLNLTAAEIIWLVENEHVEHLSDLIFRRTSLAIAGHVTTTVIEEIAAIMATHLNWSPQRLEQEGQSVLDDLRDYHGVSLEDLRHRAITRSKECA